MSRINNILGNIVSQWKIPQKWHCEVVSLLENIASDYSSLFYIDALIDERKLINYLQNFYITDNIEVSREISNKRIILIDMFDG